MKTSILFVLLSLLHPSSALDLTKVRAAYEIASKNELLARELYKTVDAHASNSTTMLGYKGAVTMMLAKFQFNPLNKLEYFNSGKALLENAIVRDADNIELIFIRFSIQSYAPGFLKYNKELNRDKYFLLTNIKDVSDKDLQTRITKFLSSSPYLSKSERNNLLQ
ncbi:MAG TPA: hypothetical protein DIU05_05655 [Bacteroidetes bacterium]|jgi:hypothetical protein|nr:hypothetical protein [Bacteroidota bacterium]